MNYKTKSEWARARATELEAAAREIMPAMRSRPYSDFRYAKAMNARDHCLLEAMRFRQMAQRFADKGQ